MLLLNELRELRDNPSKLNKRRGICGNLKAREQRLEFILLVKKWPKYSGNLSFPIPHPNYPNDPGTGYLEEEDMWNRSKAYGKLRWELLNWAIATLEAKEM